MAQQIHIPTLAGDFQPLFTPEKHGNYVNDHSIVQDKHGSWHLFGITSFTGSPADERYFVHATANSFPTAGGMVERNRVIDDGVRAWAPSVVTHEDTYYMHYGPSPTKLAVSIDMDEWMGIPITMTGEPLFAAHRDHMVLRINDYTWAMYVSGLYKGYGCISVFVSNDLCNWRFVQYALTSSGNAPLKPAWGAFESPYVVHIDGAFYLFTTYTDCSDATYHNTLVFRSENPYDFGNYTGDNHAELVIAELPAHAGEVIHNPQTNQYYLTTCGWRGKNTPHEGSVSIAPLTWTPAN